jgi:hypothetical protein
MENTIDDINKTYEELSEELKGALGRACNLVPLMYNRLTKVDGLSHKAAVRKIYKDHIDVPGFSRRNVYRTLSASNLLVQKRIVPRRHNLRIAKSDDCKKLGGINVSNFDSKLPNDAAAPDAAAPDAAAPVICLEHKNHDYESKHLVVEPPHYTIEDALEGKLEKLAIPKERIGNIISAADKCTKIFYLYFDPLGNFIGTHSM